jgi:hypothetical protein
MSVRVEGLGAVAAAGTSALGALLDLPFLFAVAVLLAVGVTISHFSKNEIRDRRAPRPPQPPQPPTTAQRGSGASATREKALSA